MPRNYNHDDYDEDDRDSRPRRRRRFRCRYCGSDDPPLIRQRVSSGGWIAFWCLIFVFPLNFFAFLIREDYRVCGECLEKLD